MSGAINNDTSFSAELEQIIYGIEKKAVLQLLMETTNSYLKSVKSMSTNT